ncbi:MAG: CvpA family protein [Piscirickettsiaceae bacterium]|nr:CvpA family protein [Piscirickettsiaceae bacterium]
MIWVDYVIIGIIVFSASISIVRGFIKEVLSLVSWALAFWVALTFSPNLSTLLTDYIASPSLRLFSAFFALFIVTLILGALINHLISTLVEKTGLSGTDRALGVVFGLLRGVAIVILLVLLAGATPMPSDSWWQDSVLLEHFETLAISARDILPADLAEYIHF